MKRKVTFTLIVAIGLLVALGYAASFLPASIVAAATQPPAVAVQSTALSAPKFASLADLETAFENIYAQVNPSVVLIQVVENQPSIAPNIPGNRGFGFGFPQQQPQQALGSGFVWDTQGHIVTNNHVIAGASSISVTFADGTTVPGKVVGADPDSDLAVVQVNVPASQLHPVQLADSTQIKVGQIAIAIGNPFGEQNTMTTGIISALGRSLPANNSQTQQGPTYTIPDVIQTDAPINPGNSGGVLLNAEGQVVGVTSAIESPVSASSGIGFAIPAAIVQKVVPALIQTGHYDHPYIGISGTTLDPTLAQAMNLKADQRGALVIDVTPNSPADKAGLRGSTTPATINGSQVRVGGDVIIAIDGQPVKTFDDLVAYLASSTQVNQTVTLTILRNGSEQSVKVTLAARPTSPTALNSSNN
jgi:serine protease Do